MKEGGKEEGEGRRMGYERGRRGGEEDRGKEGGRGRRRKEKRRTRGRKQSHL